ncbi:hypothetical protein ACFRMN_19650 [Streptomyces sp. NPDC056835]|uniref:hypothetical protein n=1 Tax=Streptomyces sp. NPDC056835 TaxID=3345956 RepID=UPI0036B365E2
MDVPKAHAGIKRLLVEVAGSIDPVVLRRIVKETTGHVEANYLPHEETAQLIVTARLEELRLFQAVLAQLLDEISSGEPCDENDVISHLIDYVSERRAGVKDLAARKPD